MVTAVLGPRVEVVRLREDRMPATWDTTFAAIPPKGQTTDGRRDGLGGARQSPAHVGGKLRVVERTHVGTRIRVTGSGHVCRRARVAGCAHVSVDAPDVLAVALRHREDVGTDLDELTAPLLPCAAAALANDKANLVVRSSWVLRSLEGCAAEK